MVFWILVSISWTRVATMFVVLFFCNFFFLRFTFFLHSKSSFRFKKRQITIMFLVNFLNGKIDHRFFSYKRKKKKREIFWSEKQKEKKIEGGGHWFFCRFFRPGNVFFNIFQLLKKMSQLLCCFKRSGNFLKKKKLKGGRGMVRVGIFIKHSSSQLFNDF